MNEWIGTVLCALGQHIRKIEDENASHRAFREMDRAQIRGLVETVDRAVAGTPDETLALEVNEKIHTIRCWTSWAGQARRFKSDVLDLLEKFEEQPDVKLFLDRIRNGAYDIIAMPGDDQPHQKFRFINFHCPHCGVTTGAAIDPVDLVSQGLHAPLSVPGTAQGEGRLAEINGGARPRENLA